MLHKLIYATLLIWAIVVFDAKAQQGFEEWNKNYEQIDLLQILAFEQAYADSIDATKGPGEYYTRIAKYRFSATYLGQKRKADPKVIQSMKNVFKLFSGDPTQLSSMIENEYLFQVGDITFWAPIQKQLEKPLKKEVRQGKMATLYCLFLNEHSSAGLYNTLLISEFQKH